MRGQGGTAAGERVDEPAVASSEAPRACPVSGEELIEALEARAITPKGRAPSPCSVHSFALRRLYKRHSAAPPRRARGAPTSIGSQLLAV